MSCPVDLQALPSVLFEAVFTPGNTRSGRSSMNSFTPLSFPKSRTALWDGSPAGEMFHLHLCCHRKPRLVLLEKALRLAQRHTRHCNKPHLQCFFLGSVSVDADEKGITVTLDRFDPGRDQPGSSDRVPSALLPGDVLVPCLFSTQNDTPETVVQSEVELHHCFRSLQQVLSRRQALDLCQVIRIRGCVICCQQSDSTMFNISWSSICPSIGLDIQPVRAVPIIPTALLRSLTSVDRPLPHTSRQRGFLTMDQTRKLLLLLESDPKAYSLPLVGLWLSGIIHVYSPQVWAWCLRFIFSTALQDRVFSENRCFLLVLFSSTHRVPQFFQCRGPEPGPASQLDYQLLTASQYVTLYQQVGSLEHKTLQCELGSENHSRQIEVFRMAQRSFNSSTPPAAALSINDQDSGVEDEDLSPRPSPSPHLPAQQARRVQPSVPELSLLIDGSFNSSQSGSAHRALPPALPDHKSAPPTGIASPTSTSRSPPHHLPHHSTPNSNLQQPCSCCASHNCTSIYPSSRPLPAALLASSHHHTPPPPLAPASSHRHTPPPLAPASSHHHTPPPPLTPASSHHHTPPHPLNPASSHHHTPPPPPLTLASSHHHTPPPPLTLASSHHHTPPPPLPPASSHPRTPPHPLPPASSHHHTPLSSHHHTPSSNNLTPSPSSTRVSPLSVHHTPTPLLIHPTSPSAPPPPPTICLSAAPSTLLSAAPCPCRHASIVSECGDSTSLVPSHPADPAPPPWFLHPPGVNHCCDQASGTDTYQLLLQQDRQLRLLQAQVQMLLEAQGKLQHSAQTVRSTTSIAVGTGASLFWVDPGQPLPHEGPPPTPTPPPLPSPTSSSRPPSHTDLSIIRPVGGGEDSDIKGQECATSYSGERSILQSPVLGESVSMYGPADNEQNFYQDLMNQLTTRLQESESRQEVEEDDMRRRSLSMASSHSQSLSSSRRKQQHSGDPVVSATLRELQHLGVTVDDEDLTESDRRIQQTVESSSTLASINPAAVVSRLSVSEQTISSLFPSGSVDLSLEANAIALRYLSDSQLSRLYLRSSAPGPDPTSSSHSLLSPSNMSVATRKYMRKYGLIEEEEDEDEVDVMEASTRQPLSEAQNVNLPPRSQLIRDKRPKIQLLAGGAKSDASEKENCSGRQPSLRKASSLQTEGSVGNILDLSRLRQLPKLF